MLEMMGYILIALAEGSLNKTRISYKANLDSRATNKYLEELLKLGLIAKSEREPSYFMITQKGLDFVQLYEGIMKMSRSSDRRP